MVNIIIFLTLLCVGYFVGSYLEKKHFKSIIAREDQSRDILLFCKRYPDQMILSSDGQLVSGNVVISIDYFKSVSAGLRNLFGGRVNAYESLLERARREAILRMKDQAGKMGANAIVNVKIETSSINKGAKSVGSVEVYAYGTALKPREVS